MSNPELDKLRARLVDMYERIIPEEIAKALASERADRDAMVEEAVDEQTRAIQAVLMDEMHDHAITMAAGRLLLEAYGEAHALYDLGECEGSVLMRAVLNPAEVKR